MLELKNNFFLIVSLFFLLVVNLKSDNVISSNIWISSNINLIIKDDTIEFPLIIKLKGFEQKELPFGLFTRTNVINKTNMLTNVFKSQKTNIKKLKKKKKSEEEKLLEQAINLFRNGEYLSAGETFRKVISKSSDPLFSDRAHIYLARIYFASNDLQSALKELDPIVNAKNESSYWRIKFLVEKTNDTEAIAEYERFKQEEEYDTFFFDSFFKVKDSFLRKKIASSLIEDGERFLQNNEIKEGKDKVLFVLGELYEKDKKNRDIKKSYSYYNDLIEKFPLSPLKWKAKERADFIRKNFIEIR